MILVANLVPSASFCGKRKAFFFKITLGRMLLSCRVNICWAKSFLKFSDGTCWSLSLIKPEYQQLYLNRLQHRCFPVKFVIFLRTRILRNICERLLLNFKDKFYFKFNFHSLNSIICLFTIGLTLFFSIPDNFC